MIFPMFNIGQNVDGIRYKNVCIRLVAQRSLCAIVIFSFALMYYSGGFKGGWGGSEPPLSSLFFLPHPNGK